MRPVGHQIPKTVWVLGFFSMFMDISSEIVHALLPLFLTAALGIGVAMVGLIDGVVEATASIPKLFSVFFRTVSKTQAADRQVAVGRE